MTTATTIEEVGKKRPRKQEKRSSSHALTRRGATGPRTQRGKQRSRYNALKHGIFAKVVLRGTALRESKAEYLAFHASLRESLQPVGGMEEVLVERLAMLAWRMARVVRAEAAIVMKQTEFLREDYIAQLKENSEGPMLDIAEGSAGVARRYENPYLLRRAVRLLELLAAVVKERGFEPETDSNLLNSLYGHNGRNQGLLLAYRVSSGQAAETTDGPTVKECQEEFLEKIDIEIERLQGCMRDQEEREEIELPLREESLAIPEDKELDRLIRYEARLEGSFDRTLSQLERLQRMRLGQPTAPPVKVELSH